MTDRIVVAGGGIIGLAVAFELLQRDLEVAVLLPEDETGTATETAAGMLAPVSEADVEHPDLVPLALDSLKRYPDFVSRVESASGLTCGYRDEGTLWVALHRDHRAELAHLAGFMADRQLTAERLDAKALRRREPRLSPRTVGGYFVPGDYQVDPRALRAALLTALARGGAEIRQACRALGVELAKGKLEGLLVADVHGRSTLPCSQAVLATGAWLGKDFAAPLPDCGMRPVRGQVLRLRGPSLIEHVIRTPDVYLVPRGDGRLIVGASSEERGFDCSNSAGATHELLRHAIATLPEVAELELEEIAVGLRPATRDHLPVIGETATAGLHLCGGHFRNGVLLAPASAALLAQAIATGQQSEQLHAFSPRRFEEVSCQNRN